jgi:tRNA modification GTPase
MYQDTIAAIATPVGEGGIGIIRISGLQAREILEQVFVRGRGQTLPPRRMLFGRIVDPASKGIVDEVLAVYMPAPQTYTREDVVEINCHGGPVALQRTLGVALAAGARLAEPGEFTLRAFLNGRIDLSQAEAVIDVIKARTATGLGIAVAQLQGRLSAEIRAVRSELVSALAYLTATIDFVDDEIPEQDAVSPLRRARQHLLSLLENSDAGIIVRQGIRAAIVGRPNVGKSSLLNALLGQDRAIVTPIPGTTRDTLEETINLSGIPLVLVDTAGITATDDLVEQIGVERSRQAIANSAIVVLVLDGSEPLQDRDREIIALLDTRPAVVAVNKADLSQALDLAEVDRLLPGSPRVSISTKGNTGLGALESAIRDLVLGGKAFAPDNLLVSNPRHREALRKAEQHLESALDGLEKELPSDLICIDLTAAVNAMGEITGETASEDLLKTIFANFCVGK